MKFTPFTNDLSSAHVTESKTLETGELIEINRLPSGFKLYGTSSVFIRGLRIGEVKALNRNNLEAPFNVLLKVYSNVIEGIPILELLPVDFKALMFIISKTTDSNFAITAQTTCPKCTAKFPTKIDLDTIDFEDLEKSVFEVDDMKFHPLRIRDLQYLNNLRDSFGEDEFEYDSELSLLSLSLDPLIAIDGLAGNDGLKRFKESYALLANLPALAYKEKISEIPRKILPDLQPLNLNCPHCGHEFSSALQLDFARIYL